MPRELQNVKVSKISLVFRPANGDAIRITKSAVALTERSVDRQHVARTAIAKATAGSLVPMQRKILAIRDANNKITERLILLVSDRIEAEKDLPKTPQRDALIKSLQREMDAYKFTRRKENERAKKRLTDVRVSSKDFKRLGEIEKRLEQHWLTSGETLASSNLRKQHAGLLRRSLELRAELDYDYATAQRVARGMRGPSAHDIATLRNRMAAAATAAERYWVASHFRQTPGGSTLVDGHWAKTPQRVAAAPKAPVKPTVKPPPKINTKAIAQASSKVSQATGLLRLFFRR